MRVAMYYANDDIRVEEMPTPVIGPGELLVKVIASGVCGSDVMEWYRKPKAPLVLGHEISGDIVRVGDGVAEFQPGMRVFVSHHVPCGVCPACVTDNETACETLHTTNFDPGGFAEYVRVPAAQTQTGTFVLPNEVSYEAGTFIEPLGCVLRAQTRVRTAPGASVLVVGSGISGLLHLRAASALGAGRLMAADVSEYRLEAARRSGAGAAFMSGEDLPDLVRGANDGSGADLVILCTGAAAAIRPALGCVAPGGTFIFFAPPPPGADLPLPIHDLWRDNVTIATAYAAAPSDLASALEMIRTGRVRVDDLVTHRLPLAGTQEGFRLVAEAGESIKVIVEPQA
jgi:L-iditol 2-dehydrogenase